QAWTDTVYLAPNGSLTGAIVLGSFRFDPVLGAGNSYTRTVHFNLPQKIQGVYTIVVKTDSAGVIDAGQADNNQLSSAALLVSLRPRPDLQIVGGTAPETVTAGAVIDVSWTVANLGPAATAIGGSRWNDAVFLSLNPTLDGGDLLLGTRQNGSSLAPGANYTTTATFTLPREIAGNAYIIVVPDRGDAI